VTSRPRLENLLTQRDALLARMREASVDPASAMMVVQMQRAKEALDQLIAREELQDD
jgi:hypothetical protein